MAISDSDRTLAVSRDLVPISMPTVSAVTWATGPLGIKLADSGHSWLGQAKECAATWAPSTACRTATWIDRTPYEALL